MKSCQDYRELISRLIDGELTEAERADVERHIETCPECAAVCEAFRSLSGLLAGDLAEPPARLRENVMAELRRDRLRAIGRRRRVIGAAAACLAVVILASVAAPRLLRKGSTGSAAPAGGYVMTAKAADAPAAAPQPAPEAEEDNSALFSACDAGCVVTEDAAEEAVGPVYVLDEERSRVFGSWLFAAREGASQPAETEPGEQLQVVFWDEGEQRTVTLLLCEDDIRFIMADGSAAGRLYCSTEELFELLG